MCLPPIKVEDAAMGMAYLAVKRRLVRIEE
jgi:hypothetical protein